MREQEFEACIQRIRSGDKEGLREIYEAYVGLIYTVVYELTGQREDAQDLTSDFFIRLWEKADSYRFGGAHKGWMVTIARNMAVDYLRKRKREQQAADRNQGMDAAGGGKAAKGFAEELVGDLSMREAMAKLKPAQRQVLDLKIMGEMTFQEIADILGKPLGTVSWQYRQGIRQLKHYYDIRKGASG
ncbi:MAG: sigma-70 family RNA polymerase sigma factor [Lachnospiraceae bacterium]|nr:sigma-70 family RNA polymerase sigma factor [Lachnospiraceae bacterium]